jgi:hypothetical protein
VASGYSLLLDAKQIGQGEKDFQNPWTPERDPQQILFSPFGQFALEGKERKENWQRLGYAWPNSNSNLNSFEKGFENLPK